MNAELYQITKEQALGYVPSTNSRFLQSLDLSTYIIAGLFDGRLVYLTGFIPLTLLSDKVYMWGHATEFGYAHPFILARHGRRVVNRALGIYPIIYGDCFEESSARWLKSFGAEFTSTTTFRIIRNV